MFKRTLLLTIIILGTITILSTPAAQAQEQSAGEVVVITAKGALNPAMAGYILRGIEIAAQRNSELVVLQLDTPGGSLDLMDDIVQHILNSPVPVAVYVSPRGAIAGSAGTIITLAGHVAAMAPGTAIGAASPVGGQGEDIEETMEAKVKEILRAQIRSLAENRPAEAIALAEQTVENAIAVSASEALEVGMIDFIAANLSDLLHQLDGLRVETEAGSRTLETEFLTINEINFTFVEQLLAILTNPNIVFILLTLGVQSILIELGSPGGWVAGFVGVVSLALAGYGLGFLPVNWFGLLFVLLAFALFYLEIKAPVHGALSIAGMAAFIIGALVLFNSGGTPEFLRVSVPLVTVTSLITAATFIAMVSFAIRALKIPVQMGQASLLGRSGIVRREITSGGQGSVHLSGEMWTAELAEGETTLPEGTRVEVVALDGVRLIVKKSTQS
ncbi:MAG: nodulation protein NfeD [Chloroflexi bacterium]|nr:nodulation protein NfeD [Chloroflexota bacterium]